MQGKFKYHINVGALSKEHTGFKTYHLCNNDYFPDEREDYH